MVCIPLAARQLFLSVPGSRIARSLGRAVAGARGRGRGRAAGAAGAGRRGPPVYRAAGRARGPPRGPREAGVVCSEKVRILIRNVDLGGSSFEGLLFMHFGKIDPLDPPPRRPRTPDAQSQGLCTVSRVTSHVHSHNPRAGALCRALRLHGPRGPRADHGAASLFLAEGAVRSGEHTTCDQHISLEEVSRFV